MSKSYPVLSTYETIDLALKDKLLEGTPNAGEPSLLDLLKADHPVFLQDPIHDDTVYVYHAFGVDALNLAPLFHNLVSAVQDNVANENDEALSSAVENAGATIVEPVLTTFSVDRR